MMRQRLWSSLPAEIFVPICIARESRWPTRAAAGRHFGISAGYVRAIEQGTRVPRPPLAEMLCEVLQLGPEVARGLWEVVDSTFPGDVTDEQRGRWLS